MDENVNQQKQSVPTPPAPEITIRTMESDVKSVEQGGGEVLAPKPIIPQEEPKVGASLNIPGYAGPEQPIFTPAPTISAPPAPASNIPTPTAPVEKPLAQPIQQPSQQSPQPLPRKSGKWKIIAIIIWILVIFAGFGLLGYYVISPWLFPQEMPVVIQ